MIFFTADLHFNHKNIIQYSNRPYSSVQQMEEEIIKNWNKTVSHNDTVYVLGDFCFGWNSNKIKEVLSKLNGIKHLIVGNHDKVNPHKLSNEWASIDNYKEINIDNRYLILSHYPIAEWNGCWYGSIHLYGHCHGKFDLASVTQNLPHKNTRCMDVGFDTNNCQLWSWDDIKNKLNIEK